MKFLNPCFIFIIFLIGYLLIDKSNLNKVDKIGIYTKIFILLLVLLLFYMIILLYNYYQNKNKKYYKNKI